jgi:glutamyl-tRNA reductase
MDLNLVGLNHKTAPIEIREKFVFSHDMLSHVLKDLKLKTGAEALILSTCNRKIQIRFTNGLPLSIK